MSSATRSPARVPGLPQALALLLPITMAVMGAVVLQPVQVRPLAALRAEGPAALSWE